MSLTIAGLDYDALMANPTIKESLVTSTKDNILSIMPALSRDNVVVELRAGSVIAEVFIISTPSVSVDLASLTATLSNPEVVAELSVALVADVQQIAGITSVATGPITVVTTVKELPVLKDQDYFYNYNYVLTITIYIYIYIILYMYIYIYIYIYILNISKYS